MFLSRSKAWMIVLTVLLILALLPIVIRYQQTTRETAYPTFETEMPKAPPQLQLPVLVPGMSREGDLLVDNAAVVSEEAPGFILQTLPSQLQSHFFEASAQKITEQLFDTLQSSKTYLYHEASALAYQTGQQGNHLYVRAVTQPLVKQTSLAVNGFSSEAVKTFSTPSKSVEAVVLTKKEKRFDDETNALAFSAGPLPEHSASVWVVQLASYTEEDKATTFVKKLQAAGYAAYVRPVSSPSSTYYRVLVGPVLSQKNADSIKASLEEQFQQVGLILKTFDPIHD